MRPGVSLTAATTAPGSATSRSPTTRWCRRGLLTYCITAPTATAPNGYALEQRRLPGCGLADVSLAKFGQVSNLVRPAADFGSQTEVSNFFNVSAAPGSAPTWRRRRIDTGRTVSDRWSSIHPANW
jgi:hypothetical protein